MPLAPGRNDLMPSASIISLWSSWAVNWRGAESIGFASCARAEMANTKKAAVRSAFGIGEASRGQRPEISDEVSQLLRREIRGDPFRHCRRFLPPAFLDVGALQLAQSAR